MAPLWRPVKIGNLATAPNYLVIITYEKSTVKRFLTFFLDFIDSLTRPCAQRLIFQANHNHLSIRMAANNFTEEPVRIGVRPIVADSDSVTFFKIWASHQLASLWYYYNIFFQNILIFRSKLLKLLGKSLRRQKQKRDRKNLNNFAYLQRLHVRKGSDK